MTSPVTDTSVRTSVVVQAAQDKAFEVFTWDISLAWQIETDPSRTSEVEVRFVPEGPERTRVELEHRHIDRHGEGWEQMRSAVASEGGWDLGLGRLRDYVAS